MNATMKRLLILAQVFEGVLLSISVSGFIYLWYLAITT